jgi:hypothetical protein
MSAVLSGVNPNLFHCALRQRTLQRNAQTAVAAATATTTRSLMHRKRLMIGRSRSERQRLQLRRRRHACRYNFAADTAAATAPLSCVVSDLR